MTETISTQSLNCDITRWGLPPLIVAWFRKKGITKLFQWQVDCLCQGKVLLGENLIYSAPTSAGKTLVADFLLLKRVLEYNKKALVIEPFVALTREKAATLKSMFFTTKARVGAFGGAYYTPGGMASVSVAVCTIEKANNFVNRLINEGKLSDLGMIVVDEIHFLGDDKRGHQLELLLTKVLFYNSKLDLAKRIQIVGLSATIPNLDSIATWLQASLYKTDYRPVPLEEKVKVGLNLYNASAYLKDSKCQPLATVDPGKYSIEKDYDDLFCMCLDTIVEGHSALVFCESKRECEIMATGLADQIKVTGTKLKDADKEKVRISKSLREKLSPSKIKDLLLKLSKCPAGSDTDLVKAIKFGIAFHHAGLTSEEREIVEDGFKSGTLKTLMATSTLSSGVNLPARLVIIKSPLMFSSNTGVFQREMLNPTTYRQMIGRAGRKNIDTCGESVLISRPDNQEIAMKLLKASLGSITSSLAQRLMGSEGEPSGLKKAVLEVIANGTAATKSTLNDYLRSTFWLTNEPKTDAFAYKNAINETLIFLKSRKFIEELTPGCYKPTRLGNAVLASGIHPDESLELLQDLIKAREGFCLLNDLHIIYQVTPNDIARSTDIKDWQHYSKIWNDLDDTCQYVGQRVGVDEIVVARRARGFSNNLTEDRERVYRRFWVALIINDLVREMQLFEICKKFRMTKAFVQQAQRTVAQFAGVISIFCNELGYANIAALVTPLESRINFSCQRDLLDLIRLNVPRPVARVLYDAGYKTAIAVAKGDKLDIEFFVRQLQPFKKEQSFTETDAPSMWVPELAKTMSTLDYAAHIVDTARNLVEIEYELDLTPMLAKIAEEKLSSQQQQAPKLLVNGEFAEPSPVKRGRSGGQQNGEEDSKSSEDSDGGCGLGAAGSGPVAGPSAVVGAGGDPPPPGLSDNLTADNMRPKDVPNFVIRYVGRSSREIKKYLDRWFTHSSISINFKVEQQVNEQIGAQIKRRPVVVAKRRRRRSSSSSSSSGRRKSKSSSADKKRRGSDAGHASQQEEELDEEGTSSSDDEDEAADSGRPSQSSQEEGIALRLDIDNKKHTVTKIYTCFGDDLTVYIIDTREALSQLQVKLANIVRSFRSPAAAAGGQHSSSSSPPPPGELQPIKLYTQNIVLTYKIFYAAFGIDQVALEKHFEWHAFDVAWWLINECPNRGLNNRNSSLSLVAKTTWARKYHHFLHPSSPHKGGKRSRLVPPLGGKDLGRRLDEYIRLKDVVKSGKTAILQPLINELLNELERREQLYAYREAEIPSRLTMAQMMVHGIGLDMRVMRDELTLYEDLSQQLTDIAQKYYAKSVVSLTSIKQVARVLYEDLDLRKHLIDHSTNSDISKDPTNGEILNILARYHPFPKLVQDFRKLGKAMDALQSVSTHARLNSELKMMRVFGQCDFWQLTGRVSMFDPDLFLINRNFTIAVPEHGQRPAESVECVPRRCFTPLAGWQFVAADYSQLELRLLAHFSNDENLLEILNRSPDSDQTYDVFKSMASRVYQKPLEEVSSENRQHAKQICYGIIYGMGNRSLAGQLGVDIEQADQFRQDFFGAFPRISEFTEELLRECEQCQYVKSLLGRRRHIEGINSESSTARARAKRVAVNTRIQSSASDLIKLAMKAVHQRILDDYTHSARLVLEMHDELIYEVDPDILNDFATVLKSTMENLAASEELRVKLLVNLKRGPDWSSLENFSTTTDN